MGIKKKVDLNGLGCIKASAQFEKRFNNSQYIAGYFNPLYEIERYQYDSASGNIQVKLLNL